MSLEPQGLPSLPYTPFGSGQQTPTSAQQSSQHASSSALGSSTQVPQPDSFANTEITLRHHSPDHNSPEGAGEATLFVAGSTGTPLSSPHRSGSLQKTSSGGISIRTSTPPESLDPATRAAASAADAQSVQFSSVHVVWPSEMEGTLPSSDGVGGSPLRAPWRSTAAAAGRHLDGDDVEVDPNATFSSDSSWATGATPRHMWTPRTVPERSMSMPDLAPDLEDAAAMHASHACLIYTSPSPRD